MLEVNLPQLHPILHTPRLTLRSLSEDDAPDLFRLRSDERVMRYLARPVMTDVSEAVPYIQVILNNYAANESVTWGICLKDQPNIIGTIGFWRMDKGNHRTEIGYILSPDYWRKGIMSEAINAACEYCFEVLHFRSVEANTDPNNEASGAVLERCGFVQEAYFRENYYFNGKFLDSRIYSKLNPNRTF
jgi:[ribosomal protein S5]-alanine N-acetyltransferase